MIISYMPHEVVKSRIEDETIKVNYCNNDLAGKDTFEGEHFGLPVYRRNYPSCYQYNVTIMLAKRLIREENNFVNRLHLDRKFAERIFNSEV